MNPRLRRTLVPYLLSLPTALWLAIFFVIPLLAILVVSLMTGNAVTGWTLSWNFSIFGDAISTYGTQFSRSFLYGGLSTVIALVVMYPVAYWIAFHGGRFKSALLFLLLLPFFVTFLIRILAWQFILADDGTGPRHAQGHRPAAGLGARALDPGRRRRRAHLRRTAVHDAAAVCGAAAHRPRAHRVRGRPLREQGEALLDGDPAALLAGHLRRHRARRDHQHRRLRQRHDCSAAHRRR